VEGSWNMEEASARKRRRKVYSKQSDEGGGRWARPRNAGHRHDDDVLGQPQVARAPGTTPGRGFRIYSTHRGTWRVRRGHERAH
jgi:hypothetical protein